MNDQQMNTLTRFFYRMPGEWWICGETLKHWVTHRELKFYDTPGIATNCNRKQFEKYSIDHGVMPEEDLTISGIKIKIEFNQKLTSDIVANDDEKQFNKRRSDLRDNGLWRVNIDKTKPYCIQIPYNFGTVLDNWKPLWWKDNDHGNLHTNSVWFTPERKNSGYELLSLMYSCAERAGIRHALWVAFGNLFGYVVCGDFLPHDTDLDVCIDTEKTTPEQDNRYLEEIKKPVNINGKYYPHGLTEKMYRFSNKRDDNNRPTWISIGHRSIENDNGVKSCNWFMFEHSNYYWHTKGDRWVMPGKFTEFQVNKNDKSICLGQPSGTLDGFTEVNFHGVVVNMPRKVGACLDWWYPGWFPGGKGSSARRRILCIPDWKNKSTWRMV